MLARWEPFGTIRRRGSLVNELTGMQQEMNRLFDEFFGERRAEMAEGTWIPAVDVSETESEIALRAELPGMTHGDIELNVQDNTLTLKGEKKLNAKDHGENFHRIERSYGSFTRSFTLPCDVNLEAVKATFKDGILTVTLPKSEVAKPKKIQISTES
ncbi:molecular chaperone [candidate division KSB3 bacterium]|uniref:Molecular chaperone n=1 Tax=candidate division KSB3 bacterium TaxID=2044937 RepID=A0A2G6KH81_9BACT|nr:MAG: molecular chaperone [candidate division KSB3 bacterium]